MTIIIGIDPGSRLTGYGVIEKKGNKCFFIDAGTIRTESDEMPIRLKRIYEGLQRIIDFHKPSEAAVEKVFLAHNVDTALKLGQVSDVGRVNDRSFNQSAGGVDTVFASATGLTEEDYS